MSQPNHKGVKLQIVMHQVSGSPDLTEDDTADDGYSAYVITTMPRTSKELGMTETDIPEGKSITVLVPRKHDMNPYVYGTKMKDAYNIYLSNFGTFENKIENGGKYQIYRDGDNNMMATITNYAWSNTTNSIEADTPYTLDLTKNFAMHDRSLRDIIKAWNEQFYQQQKINFELRSKYCKSCNCCN